jgi:hypothetical protein
VHTPTVPHAIKLGPSDHLTVTDGKTGSLTFTKNRWKNKTINIHEKQMEKQDH